CILRLHGLAHSGLIGFIGAATRTHESAPTLLIELEQLTCLGTCELTARQSRGGLLAEIPYRGRHDAQRTLELIEDRAIESTASQTHLVQTDQSVPFGCHRERRHIP